MFCKGGWYKQGRKQGPYVVVCGGLQVRLEVETDAAASIMEAHALAAAATRSQAKAQAQQQHQQQQLAHCHVAVQTEDQQQNEYPPLPQQQQQQQEQWRRMEAEGQTQDGNGLGQQIGEQQEVQSLEPAGWNPVEEEGVGAPGQTCHDSLSQPEGGMSRRRCGNDQGGVGGKGPATGPPAAVSISGSTELSHQQEEGLGGLSRPADSSSPGEIDSSSTRTACAAAGGAEAEGRANAAAAGGGAGYAIGLAAPAEGGMGSSTAREAMLSPVAAALQSVDPSCRLEGASEKRISSLQQQEQRSGQNLSGGVVDVAAGAVACGEEAGQQQEQYDGASLSRLRDRERQQQQQEQWRRDETRQQWHQQQEEQLQGLEEHWQGQQQQQGGRHGRRKPGHYYQQQQEEEEREQSGLDTSNSPRLRDASSANGSGGGVRVQTAGAAWGSVGLRAQAVTEGDSEDEDDMCRVSSASDTPNSGERIAAAAALARHLLPEHIPWQQQEQNGQVSPQCGEGQVQMDRGTAQQEEQQQLGEVLREQQEQHEGCGVFSSVQLEGILEAPVLSATPSAVRGARYLHQQQQFEQPAAQPLHQQAAGVLQGGREGQQQQLPQSEQQQREQQELPQFQQQQQQYPLPPPQEQQQQGQQQPLPPLPQQQQQLPHLQRPQSEQQGQQQPLPQQQQHYLQGQGQEQQQGQQQPLPPRPQQREEKQQEAKERREASRSSSRSKKHRSSKHSKSGSSSRSGTSSGSSKGESSRGKSVAGAGMGETFHQPVRSSLAEAAEAAAEAAAAAQDVYQSPSTKVLLQSRHRLQPPQQQLQQAWVGRGSNGMSGRPCSSRGLDGADGYRAIGRIYDQSFPGVYDPAATTRVAAGGENPAKGVQLGGGFDGFAHVATCGDAAGGAGGVLDDGSVPFGAAAAEPRRDAGVYSGKVLHYTGQSGYALGDVTNLNVTGTRLTGLTFDYGLGRSDERVTQGGDWRVTGVLPATAGVGGSWSGGVNAVPLQPAESVEQTSNLLDRLRSWDRKGYDGVSKEGCNLGDGSWPGMGASYHMQQPAAAASGVMGLDGYYGLSMSASMCPPGSNGAAFVATDAAGVGGLAAAAAPQAAAGGGGGGGGGQNVYVETQWDRPSTLGMLPGHGTTSSSSGSGTAFSSARSTDFGMGGSTAHSTSTYGTAGLDRLGSIGRSSGASAMGTGEGVAAKLPPSSSSRSFLDVSGSRSSLAAFSSSSSLPRLGSGSFPTTAPAAAAAPATAYSSGGSGGSSSFPSSAVAAVAGVASEASGGAVAAGGATAATATAAPRGGGSSSSSSKYPGVLHDVLGGLDLSRFHRERSLQQEVRAKQQALTAMQHEEVQIRRLQHQEEVLRESQVGVGFLRGPPAGGGGGGGGGGYGGVAAGVGGIGGGGGVELVGGGTRAAASARGARGAVSKGVEGVGVVEGVSNRPHRYG